MVLHDLNLASEYCDKVALLSNGKIYKQGRPEEVLNYKVIEDVYKTVVVVQKNPVSKKPYILLVSEEEKRKKK
jgi:iron complex transport system ATP-binding protein